jgi:hypothetical protein
MLRRPPSEFNAGKNGTALEDSGWRLFICMY